MLGDQTAHVCTDPFWTRSIAVPDSTMSRKPRRTYLLRNPLRTSYLRLR